MPKIENNISLVANRLEQAARDANRDPSEILLLAVSKTRSTEDIRSAINAGLTNSARTTYYYEDQVEITCNLGYRLNGNNTITCEADGRWSVIELFCESKLTITANSSTVNLKQFILN